MPPKDSLPPIGEQDCPVCGKPAAVKETKKGLAMVQCDNWPCRYQGFTRSRFSDSTTRDRMRKVNGSPHEPAAEKLSASEQRIKATETRKVRAKEKVEAGKGYPLPFKL
jgi:ssDNA-binding Zn-finger/Zn-ribbon topoisomerase 1